MGPSKGSLGMRRHGAGVPCAIFCWPGPLAVMAMCAVGYVPNLPPPVLSYWTLALHCICKSIWVTY